MNLIATNELTKTLGVSSQRIAALYKQIGIAEEETIKKGRNRHYTPNAVKKILSHRGVNYNVKEVIAFCNNKGGTGKTSLAVNTAMKLSSLGFKVLIIDADPQSNATSYLLKDLDYKYSLLDIVSNDCEVDTAIIHINDNLNIIPSNLSNSRLDNQFQNLHTNQRTYFKNLLEKLEYNYIIWDLSPSISTTNFFALLSCTQINIVTTLNDFSVQGLEMTNDVIKKAMENFDDYRPTTRALINMFDSRITSSLEHFSNISETGVELFNCVIRVDSTMSKTQTSKEQLPASSNAYKDISLLVNEIISLENKEATTSVQ